MVTKTEETQLNQLENQVENGGGGVWEYLCLVRKLKVRRSEIVLKHGLSILNDSGKRSALGPDGLFGFDNSVFVDFLNRVLFDCFKSYLKFNLILFCFLNSMLLRPVLTNT